MAGIETHLAELMKLPAVERLEAANLLFESVEKADDDPDWERSWGDELARRLQGLKDGSREPVDAATVFAEARARLKG